jgi:putative transposase
MDRDAMFHENFRRLLAAAGVRSVRTPPSAPNCNAYLERFHGSFKREAVDRLVLLGENHLRYVVDEYLVHYHEERNHQGRGGQIIEPGIEVGLVEGTIYRRERLGGIFNYYYFQTRRGCSSRFARCLAIAASSNSRSSLIEAPVRVLPQARIV